MGGMARGEDASTMTIQLIKDWFTNIQNDSYYYMNPRGLEEELSKKLNEISYKVSQHYKTMGLSGGTTFCAAIVGRSQTLVANVGDSRAYMFKGGHLEQVTKDDSLAQSLFDKKIIKEKDDMRFLNGSNQIGKCIGIPDKDCTPTYHLLDNKDYSVLLLASDGLTDCLSDKQVAEQINKPIKIICPTTDRVKLGQELAQSLVNKALTNQSIRPPKPGEVLVEERGTDGKIYQYYEQRGREGSYRYKRGIPPGIDNITLDLVINPDQLDKEGER